MSSGVRAREVEISAARLLHPLLPGSHFAHASRINLVRRPDSAVQAYLDIARQVPGWFDGLMRLRNAGMRLLGMKHLGAIRSVPARAPEGLAVGDRLGIFTVRALTADGIVLGDSDRHLRVELAVELGPGHDSCELQVSTVVHLHRPFGRLYMLPVAPLHRVIVPRLLESHARRMVEPGRG